MKTKILCISALLMFSLGACKKDALKINEERQYREVTDHINVGINSGGMDLILKPNGIADFNPGGDIIYPATYNISGKKLTVKLTEAGTKYTFSVISDEELDGENGEILKLSVNSH